MRYLVPAEFVTKYSKVDFSGFSKSSLWIISVFPSKDTSFSRLEYPRAVNLCKTFFDNFALSKTLGFFSRIFNNDCFLSFNNLVSVLFPDFSLFVLLTKLSIFVLIFTLLDKVFCCTEALFVPDTLVTEITLANNEVFEN